jgi:hypothetical protein
MDTPKEVRFEALSVLVTDVTTEKAQDVKSAFSIKSTGNFTEPLRTEAGFTKFGCHCYLDAVSGGLVACLTYMEQQGICSMDQAMAFFAQALEEKLNRGIDKLEMTKENTSGPRGN